MHTDETHFTLSFWYIRQTPAALVLLLLSRVFGPQKHPKQSREAPLRAYFASEGCWLVTTVPLLGGMSNAALPPGADAASASKTLISSFLHSFLA